MIRKVFALLFLLLALPSVSFASTISCGSSIGGYGTELFAFNSAWYGHSCIFEVSEPIEVSAISAEISRIATDQTFVLSILADVSDRPAGDPLVSGSIVSNIADCSLYTASVASTTLDIGMYWVSAVPTTHSTAYICGSGSGATVSDMNNMSVWGDAYAGGYYFEIEYLPASIEETPPEPPFFATSTTQDGDIPFLLSILLVLAFYAFIAHVYSLMFKNSKP